MAGSSKFSPVLEPDLYRPDREFFRADATTVAPLLLGGILTHRHEEGEVALRITEVEAYLGVGLDPGSHAHRGKGKRNATMFGPPGHLYVYFTYGMHACANVVCSPDGVASAVLLRAGEIVDGEQYARDRRTRTAAAMVPRRDLARGPARLSVAMGITLSDNGADALDSRFELRVPYAPCDHLVGPRTGVSGPGGSELYPWRYWLPNEETVSPYRKHVQRSREALHK